MSSIKEEEIKEPDLVYFKPVPKPAFVTPEPLMPPTYAIRNPPYNCSQPFPPRFHPFLQSQALVVQPEPQNSGICYPLTSVSQPFIQEQQRGAGDHLNLYPTTDGIQSLMTTDSLIQEEVTRAAKTLFSKRNRTLLHWLNPGVSKGQLKIDVNAAWDSLPQSEKLFYISQVLGKFAPHTTSLMVNPQLEPNSQAVSTDIICNQIDGIIRKNKKQPHKRQTSANGKRKVILLSDDDVKCDSGLVVDTDLPKTKRKYTRRKPKEKVVKPINETETSTTVHLEEKINDQVKPSEQQKPTDPTKLKENESVLQEKRESTKKQLKKLSDESAIPRVKRKYVKRKLVRKKYTRRKPKENIVGVLDPKKTETNSEKGSESFINCEKSSDSFPRQTDSGDDFDLWIDLETDVGIEDFNLLNEEVDSFWDSIEDPNSLFMELEIE